jgi:HEAT repeat protein
MHRLIEEGTRAVRLQAIRVLPLTVDSPLNRSAVVRAISDEDRDIARAAIAAAGRLRIEEAQQDLQRCVDWGAPELAREAAEALAQMAQAAAERAGLV